MLDLNTEAHRKLFHELLVQDKIFYCHFAPPRAVSLARKTRLARDRHGPPGQPPLRSLRSPDGLRGLKRSQQLRVDQANHLYSFTVEAILALHSRNIGWSIESLASNSLWVTSPFARLLRLLGKNLLGFSFHTCMHGGSRKKDTAIWTNVPELLALARTCDGTHEHEHQRGGSTVDECAYNTVLSAAWAQAIEQFAVRLGIQPPPATMEDIQSHHALLRVQANRAATGQQPRGHKAPPLLTDFLQTQEVDLSLYPFLRDLYPHQRLPHNKHFPAGARLQAFLNDDMGVRTKARVGLPLEPERYVQQVSQLVHPAEQAIMLCPEMEEAVNLQIQLSAVELRKRRLAWCKKIIDYKKNAAQDELSLHAKMAPHLKKVLAGKSLLTFRSILYGMNYVDAKIADEMMRGHPLVGWMEASGVFAAAIRPPETHPAELDKMARAFSGRTLSAIKASEDSLLDAELWQVTVDEVAAGFLDGPYEVAELPHDAVVSPRFALRQGGKTRPIDNLTASGINATVGLPERSQVEAVDEVVSTVKRYMHLAGQGRRLLGRSYDLKKAYRQLAVAEDHLRYAWIAVWSPTHGRPMLFKMLSLPFGGTASVASFLRVSRALRMIGSAGPALMWTCYFDDFICLCQEGDESNTHATVQFLFDALGWKVSQDAKKNSDFSARFSALGVAFDLSETHRGILKVGNTDQRRNELDAALQGILDADSLSPGDAERLRGRLVFAESQVFGRGSKLALRAISEPALLRRTVSPLTDEMLFGLFWMKERVLTSKPRTVISDARPTCSLFLDGACEPSEANGGMPVTTIGGILYDNWGRAIKAFGTRISNDILQKWSAGKRRQMIFEAEVLPYLVALNLWSAELAGVQLLIFIDNEAARHSWVNGFAEAFYPRNIIHCGVILEAELGIQAYFCRVPTFSNPADMPSRLDFSKCLEWGAEVTHVSPCLLRRCALSAPGQLNL